MKITVKPNKIAIVAIVTIAAVFYFWHIGRPDIVTDESSYATRAIGMIDFDFGIEQPTPWQWIDTLPPTWMRLSFHDHPPLVFFLQHLSIGIFGENPTAVRIPSAIAGIAAVWLVYLIAQRLYGNTVGLLAAALFTVTVNHVWISRIGLQESVLGALMLASIYCLLRAMPFTPMPQIPSIPVGRPIGIDKKSISKRIADRSGWWFVASGALLGFAFLTKYLAVILVPIFGTLLGPQGWQFIRRNKYYFLLSIFVFLFIASPVVIYNLQLYRTFGHFDFQLSLLFGQEVARWPSRPAQEALGSLTNRIRLFLPMLWDSHSPLFLTLAAMGIAAMALQLVRRQPARSPMTDHWPLAVIIGWHVPFLIAVGPTLRFLTLMTPWLAIAASYGLVRIGTRLGDTLRPSRYSQILKNLRIAGVALTALFVLEAGYSYSSVIAPAPLGRERLNYAPVLRRESHAWGFNELDSFLNAKLADKMPGVAITAEFPFAKKLLNEAIDAGQRLGLKPVPWGIVYDGDINISAQLWVFLRRIAYNGWPVTDAESFRRGTADFFRTSGVRRIYFVAATEYALKDRPRGLTPDAAAVERGLAAVGVVPIEIKNRRGETTFRIYEFAP